MEEASENAYDVEKSSLVQEWLENLEKLCKDDYANVYNRLRLIERLGHFGDRKSVGGNVSELRLHCGPGYRVYYTRIGKKIVFLLCAGSKSGQERDIRLAHKLAKEVRNERKG